MSANNRESSLNESVHEDPNRSNEILVVDAQTQSDFDSSAEHSESHINSTESTVLESPSEAPTTSQSNECIISVPDSVFVRPNSEGLLGVINTASLVPGIYKRDDICLVRANEILGTDRPSLTNAAAVNLSQFLSFAKRNKYDIVIPSTSSHFTSTSLPRGAECGYMFVDPRNHPHDFSEVPSYYRPELRLNNLPPRNSVLTPNIYPTAEEIQPPVVDFSAPPPYEMPLKLPTYEEVLREKAGRRELSSPNNEMPNLRMFPPNSMNILNIDNDSISADLDQDLKLLGTDFMFGIAFFLALIFNWIGFLLLMCFCHTVAARYGALSGFGLSLAKWTIIVKNSKEVSVHSAWMWWLIMAFGLLICIRSLFQYINIKRGWHLMTAATQERLLFFY